MSVVDEAVMPSAWEKMIFVAVSGASLPPVAGMTLTPRFPTVLMVISKKNALQKFMSRLYERSFRSMVIFAFAPARV